MTNSMLYKICREILFQKVALGYVLHFVQNESSENILKHTLLHNNLKQNKLTKHVLYIYIYIYMYYIFPLNVNLCVHMEQVIFGGRHLTVSICFLPGVHLGAPQNIKSIVYKVYGETHL